jgi:hypothetical protein
MSRTFRVAASLPVLAMAVLAACAHNPEPRSGAESVSAGGADSAAGAPVSLTELTGRVMNGGTDRFTITTLQSRDGRVVRLTGDLRDELRTLAGAELMVRGVMDATGASDSLDVREYEVLEIDGRRPHVGVLLARGSELWLAAADTLRLVPALDALRERAGAKVWVVGASDSAAKSLRVESYGVIAPAR